MKNYLNAFGMLLSITVLFASCKNEGDHKDTADNAHPGIETKYMDTTVDPSQDFYDFVNGNWMDETDIPSDRTSWGSFQLLRKNTDREVLNMIDSAAQNESFESGSDKAKALDIYNAELDSAAREEKGAAPLKSAINKIDEAKNLHDLQKTLWNNPVQIANPFIGIYASSLPENSQMNGSFLSPGGLGLPNRDYYTDDDSDSKKVRDQYVDHITHMLQYLGDDEDKAHQEAKNILALETKLAKPRLTKEERRDVRKLNNPRTVEQVSEMTPSIDWEEFINDLPVDKDIDTLIVTQVDYMKSLNDILKSEDIANLKNLVRWLTLNDAAGKLSPEIEKANWDFYEKTLNGAKEQRPADERALGTVNGTLGEAMGKIYVDEKFPPEAKKQAETMVENIIATYKDRIHDLDWMTDTTKKKAVKKLNKLTIKIGYPDKWKDYSDMDIDPDKSYYENLTAASHWHLNDNLSKINEPVDTTEWHMNPQTVNAYYNPSMNEIVFPAAILQPPFFDYKADAAVNYGGMGAVIGHEISHAFDDSGARFDAEGNLNNWWTEEDLDKFKKRTQKLKDFYSDVKVEDSLHLNGDYTAGENAADLAGVLAAYHGLQRYFEDHDKPDKIDGFTPEQRFFMSWATVWRTKTRPEALRSQIKTDPHSPGIYRAYLPLQNVDTFYDQFDINEGDSMFVAPDDRVRIW